MRPRARPNGIVSGLGGRSALSALLIGFAFGCTEDEQPREAPLQGSAETRAPLEMPLSGTPLEPPDRVSSSLDAQIAKASANVGGDAAELARLLRVRFAIFGRLADLDASLAISEISAPKTADEWVLRARGRIAIRRFALAQEDLAQADALSPKRAQEWMGERASIELGTGHYDRALAHYGGLTVPSIAARLEHAELLGRLGRVEESDGAFVGIERELSADAPADLTIALVETYSARAAMWERAGDFEKAATLFREAHRRLPQHVHVAIHTAMASPPSEGALLLERLASSTDDPELFAALGVLKNQIKAESGDASIARAKTRMTQAMERYPELFAERAGWFWSGVGSSPKDARDAATINLRLGKTSESLSLYLAAREDDCEAVAEAMGYPHPAADLRYRLSHSRCGAP